MEWILWLKALHIVAVISWMAGLLYLPRLFVYHSETEPGSPQSETFKIMEQRLLNVIMKPAMFVSWLAGLLMVYWLELWAVPWFWVKFAAVFVLSGVHGHMSACQRGFEKDERNYTARYFRILNEVPTLLMVVIVIMVIVRPF